MAHLIALEDIWAEAVEKEGGEATLEGLLLVVKTAVELKKILDDQWLAEMTKWTFQAGLFGR